MGRQSFYDIISGTSFNARVEYERIRALFCSAEYGEFSIQEIISDVFLHFPEEFRKRTISLEDFNNVFGFNFSTYVCPISVDELINYCEYITNLCNQLVDCCPESLEEDHFNTLKLIRITINSCMDEIGQSPAQKGHCVIFVDKDPAALAVAEVVDKKLAFSVLEYNHHKLKGNLDRKHLLLKLFADDFESKRKQLRSITGSVESQLGELFNKFVRHDHSKTPYIGSLDMHQLESIYDDIYQMYLLSNLQLDNLERKQRMTDVLNAANRKD